MNANRNPFSLVTRFSAAFFLDASLSASLELISAIDCLPPPVADDAIHLEPVGLQICIDLSAQFCRNLASGVLRFLDQPHQFNQPVVEIEERAMVAVGLTDYAVAQHLHQARGLFACRIGKLTLDTL